MVEEVFVFTELNNPELKVQVLDALSNFGWLKFVEEAELVNSPDVFLLNDDIDVNALIKNVSDLSSRYPNAEIFVISSEKNPEHIVDVIKAGASEFFPNKLNVVKLQAAIERVHQNLINQIATTKGQLFSFVSSKGGLGSTVVSVNIAAALALKKKGDVALLDMSLQSGDSSVYLDTLPLTTLAEVCKSFHRLDLSLLKMSMLRHASGFDYLAAPKDPEDSGSIHGPQIKKILHLAKTLYDHVVVDCSSMLVDECSLEVYQASDRIFILTDLSVPAVRNAGRLNLLMQKLGIPRQKIEIVVNRYIKGGASLHDVEKSLQKNIFWLFPNDFVEVIASINAGVPLVKSKSGAPFTKNIFEFIEKLTNPGKSESYRGIKGFLGKAI